ncbi:MAG: glycoside hydrolase family 44 protein [Terracidiphilus sp.]
MTRIVPRFYALLPATLPAILAIGFCSMAALPLSAQNAATSVSVDASANQHAINPNIYGLSVAGQSDISALNAPLNRLGGETLASTYNWQIDALNESQDWYWSSYLQDSPQVPGAAVDSYIQATYNAAVGSDPMVSIPMMPYIANLGANPQVGVASIWSYSVAKYGAQQAVDPYQADAGNGISTATGEPIVNNPLDAYVPNSVSIQSAWLQHLIGKWGLSTTSTGVKYYILDNEPSLWSSTHRDIHPALETYDEEYNNIVNYATAIRAADPNAKIIGPEEWVWWAMFSSGLDQKNGTGAGSDYATHNNTYYYPWLLQQLYAYQQAHGTRLIDGLSIHCYNQEPGDSDDSASGQATRNRYTRILWDPTYTDPSWQGTLGINGGVEDWIPLMRSWVNQYYPGLQIGCTEYNWGDEPKLNGATTQADVEGIYGVYGFDFATRWTVPANPSPTYLAMEMYRNYDGNLSTFGDTSVSATVANPDNLSAYAATRTSDGALTVMVINKQQGTTPVTVSLANFANTGTAQAWQISSATQTSITSLGSVTVASNTISATLPSQSITLFVVPAGSVETAPSAPTGLAATVGSGTVTLTWNAAGGATSYNVLRSSSSTGTYASIGTVTTPAPTTFTNSGLTNGTTYYYEVSGTNSAGTGPASSPIAATPLVPPTFTSSATASPNPVVQNASTTITATVKCTANSLSNGVVEIIALDPNGAIALTKSFTAQTFTANQTQTYTAALTPTLVGTYTVEVVVTSAAGQQWSMNSSAGSITVSSALTFTASAAANPTSINASGSSTVSITVKDTGTVGLTNGIVQLLVINPSGTQIVQQNWTGQNIAAGGTLSLTYTFDPSTLSPPATATGTYTIDVGVFDSTWSTNYYWNGDAATITLQASTPAALTSPTPGVATVLGASNVVFKWTAGTGVTLYQLNLSAIAPGQNELFTYKGTALTATAAMLPKNGIPVYVTLYSYINGAWQWNSYLYTEAGTSPGLLKSPTPGVGTILGTSNVLFQWTTGAGVSDYQLNLSAIGSGQSELFSYKGTATSATALSLPANGATVYATLYSNINGVWVSNAYEYTESGSPTPAVLQSPTPGSTTILGTSDVPFQWSPGGGVSLYELNLSAVASGGSDLYLYKGAATSAIVPAIPANGVIVYATLYSLIKGTWQKSSYEYTESGAPTPGALTSPAPGLGTILGASNVLFKWNAGTSATVYQLNLSAIAPGDSELFSYKGPALSATAPTLPANGVTVYARLYSYIDGVWLHNDYVYTEQ